MGEFFKTRAAVSMVHVPYKGGAPAVNAILTGQVQLNFAPIVSTALPHVKSGVLRALAVSTAQRWPSLPDVPSLAESGITGYDYASWVGMFAPAKTNAAIVNRLWNETSRAARGADGRVRGGSRRATRRVRRPELRDRSGTIRDTD